MSRWKKSRTVPEMVAALIEYGFRFDRMDWGDQSVVFWGLSGDDVFSFFRGRGVEVMDTVSYNGDVRGWVRCVEGWFGFVCKGNCKGGCGDGENKCGETGGDQQADREGGGADEVVERAEA